MRRGPPFIQQVSWQAEEFPKFDVGQRSAASIARRLQDPLAELVKIDPKAIGVGQYQHDMNQKKLGESLNGVVEDCVNKVGVDLNTASAPLACIYFRNQQSNREKYCCLPGRKWQVYRQTGTFKSTEAGAKSL